MASRRAFHILTPSRGALHLLTASRGISSTPYLASLGWFDKIKSTFTGKKPEAGPEGSSFTLIQLADTMEKARKLGTFKNFVAGRASEATVVEAFEKHSAVLRYLGAIDPTGEKLQISDKINASKHCNCTIADVEHILAKYTWAKEAQMKIEKLKKEGKPMPTSFNETTRRSHELRIDKNYLGLLIRVLYVKLFTKLFNKASPRCRGIRNYHAVLNTLPKRRLNERERKSERTNLRRTRRGPTALDL